MVGCVLLSDVIKCQAAATGGGKQNAVEGEIFREPTQEQLKKQLAQIYKDQIEKQQQLDNYQHLTVRQQSTEEIDNSECERHTFEKPDIRQKSVCPWRYKHTKRTDRYPFDVIEAECTCKRCANLKSNTYLCMPVMQRRPVLIRSSETVNGVYKYTNHTELISIACICSLTRTEKIITHK